MPTTWAQAAPNNPKESCILLQGNMAAIKLGEIVMYFYEGTLQNLLQALDN